MSKKIVTLGEVMLRLSPPGHERFVQAESLDVTYGGGEANVAAALSIYGSQGVFISKVPDNPIGQSAINHLRRYGVDTQFVIRGGNRLGIYFLENGASARPAQVVYDRKGSSISETAVSEFDFDKILDGADWFHTSGITPALSDKAFALTEAALKTAKAKGITTSLDLNFRKKLWTEDQAREALTKLCQYVEVCMGCTGHFEHSDSILGFKSKHTRNSNDDLNIEGHREVFRQLQEEFGFKYMTTTLRVSHSASDNDCSALVYDGQELYHTKQYQARIVDRVGTGDAFAAGFIYGLVSGMSPAEAGEFGTAAMVLKHTIPGDMNHATKDEVLTLMKGDTFGRVLR